VGIPVNALLGLVLTGSRVSVAPAFHTVGDTHRGGSVLWIVGELVTLVAMAIVVSQWMRYEQREAVRADRRLDALEAEEARHAEHACRAEDADVDVPAPVEAP